MNPVYDKTGNMTTMPQPSSPWSSYNTVYNAWNRPVKLWAGGSQVAAYQYNGLKRRTVKQTFVGGILNITRYFYYSRAWQVLEERTGLAMTAERQFVWGRRYVDDLVLRDRDSTGGGTLNERLYGLQDSNWNLTGAADTTGWVQERYGYDAYGVPTVMAPGFLVRAETLFDWEIRYAGYRWDEESGLYQVKNREFLPRLGRFVTRDPLGLAAGDPNLYAYVQGNPTTLVDPSGQLPVFLIFAGVILLVSVAAGIWGYETGDEAGTVEGFAPGWGPGRTAGAAIRNDQPVKAVCYSALAILDACLIGSLGKGIVRVGSEQGLKGFLPSSFRVAIGPGASAEGCLPHMAWSTGQTSYYHTVGDLGRQIVTSEEAGRFWMLGPRRNAPRLWFRMGTRRFLLPPVANRGLASLTGGGSWTCYDATLRAWSRGTYHLVPYIGSHAIIGSGRGSAGGQGSSANDGNYTFVQQDNVMFVVETNEYENFLSKSEGIGSFNPFEPLSDFLSIPD